MASVTLAPHDCVRLALQNAVTLLLSIVTIMYKHAWRGAGEGYIGTDNDMHRHTQCRSVLASQVTYAVKLAGDGQDT